MYVSHLSNKIKSLLSFGYIKTSTNKQFKQVSDNLASCTSKLRSFVQLLPFIGPFFHLQHSCLFQTSGGY